MTIEQAWLPEQHLADPKLTRPFSSILKAWCENWFAEDKWTAGKHWVRELPSAQASETIVFELESGLQCLVADRGRLAVAAAMLSLPVDKGSPARADAQLIAKIAEKALADLGDKLCAVSAAAKQVNVPASFYIPNDWPSYRLDICREDLQPILSLRADKQLLVRIAESLAPLPRALPDVWNRDEAIAIKKVRIGARIGAAKLTLAELRGLGIGDVIALDQSLHSNLALMVDDVEALPSAFMLKTEQEILQLQLTRSIS